MKKRLQLITTLVLLIILTSCLSSCTSDRDFSAPRLPADGTVIPLTKIINPDSEVRGVWIASVFNIDYPSSADLSAEDLRAEIDEIISTCKQSGVNTIYFQVRPSCDALYESDIFPVSKYLSSSGELTFDPLGYIVETAHRENIFVHAWVNPLRVTADGSTLDSLPDSSPAKAHPEWVVEYSGKLYFDAGIPEVRTLISDGVSEIVRKYDVDGVVFDDYFYPYPVYGDNKKILDFDDGDTYAVHCGNFTNVEDWRRENVNEMIRACYEAVHQADKDCVFGVAPFGVWQNNNGKNGGSDTANLEAYSSLYCDALAWVNGGYIDFLSPQIYWEFTNKTSPYDVVLRWWNAKLDGTGVKLIVSHALHQYNGDWKYPEGEITEQIVYSRSEKQYYGSVCYGYSVLKNNVRGAADELKKVWSGEIVYTGISSTGSPVTFSSPENDSVTYNDRTFLLGQCDPAYPLTMGGEPISMTKSGYFSTYLHLTEGENVFVFTQNGKEYEYKITYKTSYDGVTEKTGVYSDTVDAVNIYPMTDTATSDGTMWVQCYAPNGSTVTASVGGISTKLKRLTDPVPGGKGYACVLYGAEISLPSSPDGVVTDCGNIILTVEHKDGTATKTGGRVRILGEGASLCVRAKEDYTELKITENSLYYNDYTVQSAGMTDYADALSDGFYHLRMGGYVYESAMEEIDDPKLYDKCRIESVKVSDDGERTSIVFRATDSMPYNGCIDGDSFVVTFYNADGENSADAEIGENPFFESCDVIRLEKKVRYSFPLYDTDNFYGFDLMYGDGEIVVTLRDPVKIDATAEKPLEGKIIVLDAGHGGEDSGAVGMKTLGGRADEKDVNLAVVLATEKKLSSLGADVRLTRSDDSTFSLVGNDGRMKYLEALEPDLCVSVHQNSDEYTKDIRSTRGTLGLWCMDGGTMLAECVSKSVADALGRMWQDSRYQMLAMCRNPKFPAALIEVGYMTSAEEYELMTTEVGVNRAAGGIVDGILEWYSRQEKYIK